MLKSSGFLLFALGLGVGILAVLYGPGSGGDKASMTAGKPLYWVAPMDPSYRRDNPGKSPMGMDLIPVYEDSKGTPGAKDPSVVEISPEVINNLGVRSQKATRGNMSREIETVGYIDFDEKLISHVHLRTEGWIEKLTVNSIGQRVRKGDLLLELYSPEQVNAQAEFLQVLGTKQRRLIEASRERLVALGVAKSSVEALEKTGKISQRVRVYAPQNGVVASLPVREGMYVKPSVEIMSLADLSQVWLLADVFEKEAAWVKVGQEAQVHLPYLPGKTWTGKVSFIYPSLDPRTRSLKVRLTFENPKDELKPEMFASIRILVTPKKDVLSIPRQALIVFGTTSRVIKDLGGGRFKPITVTTGMESGDRIEILSGLEDGDLVVTSAQFLIDSESNLRAGLSRIQAPEKTPEMEMDDMDHGDMDMEDMDMGDMKVAPPPMKNMDDMDAMDRSAN